MIDFGHCSKCYRQISEKQKEANTEIPLVSCSLYSGERGQIMSDRDTIHMCNMYHVREYPMGK